MSEDEIQESIDARTKEENQKSGEGCELDNRDADPAGSEASKIFSSPPSCGNGAEAVAFETEYILSEDLKPLEGDITKAVDSLLPSLDSKDWICACEALNYTRQLATFHPASIFQILDSVVNLTVKAMKNPRSALCKTAIMTSSDFFKSYQDQMLDRLDPLLMQLLLKASQDKRFVCEEAEKALLSMTTFLTPIPLLLKLQPCLQHRNPRVRAKAASCIYRSVTKLGSKGIKDFGMEKLIRMGASHLNDQLPEARDAARQLVMEVREAHQQQHLTPTSPSASSTSSSLSTDLSYPEQEQTEQWEQYCRRQLPPRTALAVLRATCTSN